MKKSLVIATICIFILTSTMASAGNNEKDANFSNINFTDKVVYVLDHTSNPSEGNWITVGSPYEDSRIQFPHPIKITYSGPKSGNYKGVSWNLSSSNDKNYKINYPSTPSYTTLPVYLPGRTVNMSFFGDSALEGNADIYVLNVTSKSALGILEAFNTGDIGNLEGLFHKNMDGNFKKYSAALGEKGDLLDYNLGSFDPGQYCIVMIQKNEDGSLTVFSATAFVVSEYVLKASAPASIEDGKNLDISMELEGAPVNSNYTYGAVLVNEQAYKANIDIISDGTKKNSSVIVNGVNLIDKFEINSSNYKSKLTKNELQKEVQTIIGEGNGSIAIGENGQKKLSLTTFDLPTGKYYLFVGAYRSGKGLVGLTQLEVDITLPIPGEDRNPHYSIFKSVIAPDEDGDCIVNSPGDEIPYRIVVKNDGNVDLTGVSVVDPMITLTGPTGDDIDPEVLNPGEVWAYTGIYKLTPDDISNGKGSIDNTATVRCNELTEETSDVNQPIDQNADLSIQKSIIGIDEAGDYMINQPGDVINYQIAVKNNGAIDLTGVSVSDPMIALARPNGDHTDPGVLNPGETWVYKGDYRVTQADIDSNGDGNGFIENTASAYCNELSRKSSSIGLPIVGVPSIPPIIVTESKVLPVANFNANPMSGYAPLAVQFTDASQNAESRSWDFGDGARSTEKNPMHTYSTEGTYTTNLTVSNANRTDSKTVPINVLQVSSSGGGSGGRSGSGSSPESAKNIKSKELSQQYISNGKVIRFEFPKGLTPVVYLEFKAKKTVGDTTATIEELKEQSILTPNEPIGEIYKHINVWVGNSGFANPNNIENATVGFKVSKYWINESHIKVDSLVLQHFDDEKWNSLPTKKVGEDKEYIYFEAKTPSFSPFAISAEKLVIGDNGGKNQALPEITPQDKQGTTAGTDNISQEDENGGISKLSSFFIGLLVILLVGAIILKKKGADK